MHQGTLLRFVFVESFWVKLPSIGKNNMSASDSSRFKKEMEFSALYFLSIDMIFNAKSNYYKRFLFRLLLFNIHLTDRRKLHIIQSSISK